MPLPVVPLDSPNEKQHRTVIATSLNELVKFFNTIESGSWTPVVQGSGTAGTYEIASHLCRYSRIGRRVFLDVSITFAGAVTGGGTGYMQITGVPYAKSASTSPIGPAAVVGVDFTTAGASLSLSFITSAASSIVYIFETVDAAGGKSLPIAGIGASDAVIASICYETDDP
jgi:hypothetical protein